jgi:hypothetical protein
MANQSFPESISSEYGAARAEILFRLKAQQDIINYSLAVAGALGVLLGLILNPNSNTKSLFALLLLGPLFCVFLQAIYLKHHIFNELLEGYISTQLGIKIQLDEELPSRPILPFAGWERYLTSSLYQDRQTNFISAMLGYAEGGFPTLIGILYLVAFRVVVPSSSQSHSFLVFLDYWFIADCIGLGVVVLAGILIRRWVIRRRQSATHLHNSH